MAGRGGVVLPKLVINGDPFGRELKSRLARMVSGVEAELESAARTATTVSRATFDSLRSRRPFVPDRPGRSSTQGRFSQYINWDALRRQGGDLYAVLDIAKLEEATPTHYGGPGYWLIQEIGTGNEAAIRVGGADRYSHATRVAVKSQVGRLIPNTLGWQSAGGVFSAAQRARYGQDQLAAAAGASRSRSGVTIGREIQGKHFLQAGGTAGFDQFKPAAVEAARQAFAGRKRP